ncbi:FAD-dependent monooxygenase [Streptomyces sp. bgisy159]|uniref:FAD-dependent monooxygenase n=1 Tax=Streptomyces sp. bgisy159 TaxID=3413795 RepID=UPI003F49F36D
MLDVLIAGAGPTGLTLGVDLARRGVRALVIEAGDDVAAGSRGKGLQPRTMEVFEDLGVLDAVLAAGGRYPVSLIWKNGEPAGEHVMFDPAEEGEKDCRFMEPWMVPQERTARILLARLGELGGSVRFGARAVGVEQDADGVTVRLADGEALRARHVVAADGGRSTVRRALGVAMTGGGVAPGREKPGTGEVDPDPFLVTDVRIPGLDRGHWHMFPPPREGSGFLALCPLAGTEDFQLVAGFPGGGTPDLSLAGVRAVVAERTHLAAGDVTAVSWVSAFRPRAALADRFRVGRVFLAGDAAHVHSPAGGQGLNTSVQDAYNLGWKLGAVLHGGAPPRLLDTYEEERRPVAAAMLGLSTAIHRAERTRGAATRQLGLHYRESPLSEETRRDPGPLRAGDRFPDVTVDGVRLFDRLRGPRWTSLTLDSGVYLVRPDGYVGWAGETPEGLDGYRRRWSVPAA